MKGKFRSSTDVVVPLLDHPTRLPAITSRSVASRLPPGVRFKPPAKIRMPAAFAPACTIVSGRNSGMRSGRAAGPQCPTPLPRKKQSGPLGRPKSKTKRHGLSLEGDCDAQVLQKLCQITDRIHNFAQAEQPAGNPEASLFPEIALPANQRQAKKRIRYRWSDAGLTELPRYPPADLDQAPSPAAVRSFNWDGIHFEVSGETKVALTSAYSPHMNLLHYDFNRPIVGNSAREHHEEDGKGNLVGAENGTENAAHPKADPILPGKSEGKKKDRVRATPPVKLINRGVPVYDITSG